MTVPTQLLALLPSLGPTEIFIVVFIILLLFGAKKLPELARSMGSSIKEFKKSVKDDEENETR